MFVSDFFWIILDQNDSKYLDDHHQSRTSNKQSPFNATGQHSQSRDTSNIKGQID